MRRLEPYTREPPHPCERLARIEGESAWFKNLAGIEECADMTEPMAALAFGRRFSGEPMESLEVKWGGSRLHVRALSEYVLRAIEARAGKPIRPSDRVWMKAAVRDAVEIVRGAKVRAGGAVPPIRDRAKAFHVHTDTYGAVRSVAQGIAEGIAGTCEPAFVRALFRDR
jgi:hypothetical protein